MQTLFKTILKFFVVSILLLSLILYTSGNSFAQDEATGLEDMLAIFTEEQIVVSALKRPRTVSKSPAIMSVITARQIKQMGFRTLTEILDIVPGFDIIMTETGEREIAVRGILDTNSQKVKVLIDGHSINSVWQGGVSWNFDDLIVENIKRIEIIRGPGSALYGQNAFLAVVNVITKDTEDIDGFQLTTSGGSFSTQNYSMLFGKEYGDLEISGFLDYYDTEGFSKKIEQDAIFGDPSSKSPGQTPTRKEKTDLNLKLSYNNLTINSKYMKKRRKDYLGVGNALNDETIIKTTYIFTELSYKLALGEKLNIMPKIYYDQHNYDPLFERRPDGFSVFADGMKGLTTFKARTFGFENQFNYNLFKGNELTLGFQYEYIVLHDVRSAFNFNPQTNAPLPVQTDFAKTLPFARESKRNIWALYLQDEWNITDDVDLTVGVRHDQFTRFGGTTNPRLGLIWRFIEDAHLKILLATAFRAPNFQEMYLANNPTRVGNPNLDPEKINTYEVGLGYNFTKHIRGNINYFYNRIRDRIILDTDQSPDKFANSSGARIIGVEAELKADFGDDNYAFANYTFQKAEETRTRNRLEDVPVHKANLGVNVGFWKYANANVNTLISGPRPREDGDTRRKIPSYALVNLTVITRNFMDNFEIKSSIFNLFDKSYEDPSPVNTVPTDFPQPGRSFIVELQYQF